MSLRTAPEPLPRPAGWAALGAFTVLVLVGVGTALPDRAVLVVAAGATAVVAAVLAGLGPARAALPALVLAGAAISAVCFDSPANVGWFAVVVLVAWLALTQPPAVTVTVWIAFTALFVVQATAGDSDPGWFAWIAGTAFSAAGCLVGRRQHDLVMQLRAAQAGLAHRAQVEERARIARELHDVIAHSLTVSLMHVSAARLALDDAPEQAERALAEAERLGRASLDEVRHAVGTLRTRGDDVLDPTRPLPGSTDVPALLAGFTDAGLDVHATVDAELATLPATVGLAAYRVLQEALTNAAKHAAGCPVTVQIARIDGVVHLEVDSAGPPRSGTGLGLVGMHERAASVGGTLTAGPGGRGWLVRAELPVGAP